MHRILPGQDDDDAAGAVCAVILTGNREMARLNDTFLGHEGPTDVIAFDLSADLPPGIPESDPPTAGEIYVNLDIAARAAREYSTSMQHETLLYIVHGLLHLAGERDDTPKHREAMRNAEQHVMDELEAGLSPDAFFASRPARDA